MSNNYLVRLAKTQPIQMGKYKRFIKEQKRVKSQPTNERALNLKPFVTAPISTKASFPAL